MSTTVEKEITTDLGDATPDQVLAGTTFTSNSGIKQQGELNLGEAVTAGTVKYDNSGSTLEGNYVQQAIDELDTKVENKSNLGHTHDDRYYTEAEVNAKVTALQNGIDENANDITALQQNVTNQGNTLQAGITKNSNDITTLQESKENISVTETTETTLPNSHSGRVLIEHIGGNMEQGENPSPESPQEIKGVKGKNLLDCRELTEQTVNGVTFTPKYSSTDEDVKSGYPLGSLMYVEANNTATADADYVCGSFTLLPKEEYIFSGCPNGGSATTYRMGFTNVGNEYGSGVSFSIENELVTYPFIRITSGYTATNLRFYPMIRSASVFDDTYVPYGLLRIKGTKKNRFKNTAISTTKDSVEFTVYDDGSVYAKGTSTSAGTTVFVLGEVRLPKGSYIESGCLDGGSNKTYCIRLGLESKGATYLGTDSGSGNSFELQEEKIVELRIHVVGGTSVDGLFKPMIREASIEDDTYESYTEQSIILSQPMELYGNENVQDLFTPKEVERKWFVKVFDGTESLTMWNPTSGGTHFGYADTNIKHKDSEIGFTGSYCNYLKEVEDIGAMWNTPTIGFILGTSGTQFRFRLDTTMTTIEEAQAWLAEKYAEGNPFIIVVPLAEPTTEPLPLADQIALNSLQSFDGITYVEFDCEVQPTWSAKYGTSEVGAKALEAYADAQIAQITNADDAEDIQQLQEEVKSHAAKLKAHSNSLTSLSKENVYRQNDISDTNSRIDTLQSSVNTNTDDISNLKSASSAAMQNISVLQGQVNTMGQTVSANVGDIKLLQDKAHTHSRTVLWTNPNPTAEITTVQEMFSMTLESYELYEFYLITYYTVAGDNYPTRQALMARAADYGNGTNIKLAGFLQQGSTFCYHERGISYSHDSQAWKVSGCSYFDASGNTQAANDRLIPYQIIGIK